MEIPRTGAVVAEARGGATTPDAGSELHLARPLLRERWRGHRRNVRQRTASASRSLSIRRGMSRAIRAVLASPFYPSEAEAAAPPSASRSKFADDPLQFVNKRRPT